VQANTDANAAYTRNKNASGSHMDAMLRHLDVDVYNTPGTDRETTG